MAMPNFELSDYEKTRVPHEPKTDNDRVTIAWSSIADHMKCPVCLNIIADTMTTDVRLFTRLHLTTMFLAFLPFRGFLI